MFQTSDCCATGFGIDSTILPNHFPILFLREKVCCRKWYSQGTKVFRGSHKNFHLYKNNCQTIPTYTSCVSKSNELNFGLLFEVLNQNFDDFPLQVFIFFLETNRHENNRASNPTAVCIDRFVILCALNVFLYFRTIAEIRDVH